MASELAALVNQVVCVITSDGRHLVGTLKGFDQQINIVLSGCHERIVTPDAPPFESPIGAQIVHGSNVVLIAEVDHEIEASTDLGSLRGHPVNVVTH